MTAKLLVLAMTCLLMGSAPRQPATTLMQEARFEGVWEVTRLSYSGNELGIAQCWHVVFAARQVTVQEKGQKVNDLEFDYHVNHSIVPLAINLQKDHDIVLGICQFQGDELKICLAAENQPRPVEFSAKAGLILIVLRRVR